MSSALVPRQSPQDRAQLVSGGASISPAGTALLASLWYARPAAHARMNRPDALSKYTRIPGALSDRQLADHLAGRATYAAALIGADGLACAGALDIDQGGESAVRAALQAAQLAGLSAWAITSRNDEHDGGWVWVLYRSPVEPARIRAQLASVAQLAKFQADLFPTRQDARLPFGVHRWSGRRGVLLLQDGRRIDLDAGELEAGIAAVATLPRNAAPPALPEPERQQAPRAPQRVAPGDDAIGRYCREADLVALLTGYPGYRVVSRTARGALLRCGCPHHKHGDRRPSLEVRPGCDGRQVVVGYAPACVWHNPSGRNDAFNVYCQMEGLSPRGALRRLARPSPVASHLQYAPHPAEQMATAEPDQAKIDARQSDAERKRAARRDAAAEAHRAVERRLANDNRPGGAPAQHGVDLPTGVGETMMEASMRGLLGVVVGVVGAEPLGLGGASRRLSAARKISAGNSASSAWSLAISAEARCSAS